MNIIEIKGLWKSFNGTPVLQGVDLDVRKGETLVIIGRSGTGKSVTLKNIMGLLMPDRGTVKVFGTDIASLNRKEILKLRLKIGYLFQNGALLNWMSIGDNVTLPLLEHKPELSKEAMRRIVEKKLEIVELDNAGDKFPSEISGGMKKRAGLARAIVMDPEIILYDEPTSGLDPVMAGSINELVRHTQNVTSATQLVVSHDMDSAFSIADRIAMLYQGRIIALGTPEELKRHDDPVVQQFISGNPDGPITNKQEATAQAEDGS